MTATVFAAVLLSAVLHAGWNVLVKRTDDPRATAMLVVIGAGFVAAAILPFVDPPAAASLPWLAGAVVLQVVYVLLLATAYRVADMSLVYPTMRGSAPMIVTAVSIGLLDERLSATAWFGIATIALGILSLALGARRTGGGRGVAIALLTACAIAGSTLVDGRGVRLSGSPVAYTLWEGLLTGLPFLGWAIVFGGARFRAHARRHFVAGLAGGVGTTASYGVALWAMTQAPVALVAALRETSIVFGLILARLVLGERAGGRRLAAAGLILLGAAVLRAA